MSDPFAPLTEDERRKLIADAWLAAQRMNAPVGDRGQFVEGYLAGYAAKTRESVP